MIYEGTASFTDKFGKKGTPLGQLNAVSPEFRKRLMEFSRRRIIKIAVTVVFLGCMFFANFIAVRMMFRYGVDAYFYDKLLVAYTIGGEKGLRIELANIPVTDNLLRESMLAKNFAVKLETLTDPGVFLKDKVQKSKKIAFSIRNLRSAAIIIMFILFCWQLIVKFKFSKLSP